MSDEPCPHCGPLQAEVERLRLRIFELEAKLSEARTRGLCDAVELIVKRARQSGYSAHVTLHDMADEIRQQYFALLPKPPEEGTGK